MWKSQPPHRCRTWTLSKLTQTLSIDFFYFVCLVFLLTIKISQWACENWDSYCKLLSFTISRNLIGWKMLLWTSQFIHTRDEPMFWVPGFWIWADFPLFHLSRFMGRPRLQLEYKRRGSHEDNRWHCSILIRTSHKNLQYQCLQSMTATQKSTHSLK